MRRVILRLTIAAALLVGAVTPSTAGEDRGQGVWREPSVFPQPRDPWRDWGRRHHEHEYFDPSYQRPGPPPRAVWVPGYWVWDGHRWVWIQGYWRR
jgi:hypothetical protein